ITMVSGARVLVIDAHIEAEGVALGYLVRYPAAMVGVIVSEFVRQQGVQLPKLARFGQELERLTTRIVCLVADAIIGLCSANARNRCGRRQPAADSVSIPSCLVLVADCVASDVLGGTVKVIERGRMCRALIGIDGSVDVEGKRASSAA